MVESLEYPRPIGRVYKLKPLKRGGVGVCVGVFPVGEETQNPQTLAFWNAQEA